MKLKRILSAVLAAGIFASSLMCGNVTASAASDKMKIVTAPVSDISKSEFFCIGRDVYITDDGFVRIGEKELSSWRKTGKLKPTKIKADFTLPKYYDIMPMADGGDYTYILNYFDENKTPFSSSVLKYNESDNSISLVREYAAGKLFDCTPSGYAVNVGARSDDLMTVSIKVDAPNGKSFTNTFRSEVYDPETKSGFSLIRSLDGKYIYYTAVVSDLRDSDGIVFNVNVYGVDKKGNVKELAVCKDFRQWYIAIQSDGLCLFDPTQNKYAFITTKNGKIYTPDKAALEKESTLYSFTNIPDGRYILGFTDGESGYFKLGKLSGDKLVWDGGSYGSLYTVDGKMFLTYIGSKWYYLDKNGKQYDRSFDDAYDFFDSCALVQNNGKVYFIDKKFNRVSEYVPVDKITDSSAKNLCRGEKDGKDILFTYVKDDTVPAPSGVKAKKSASGKAEISWSKVSGASGYEVYMASSKDGKYEKAGTVKKAATVSFTKSGLKSGKTYYFKVRAYKTVDGKKVYSKYSDVKSVKV